MGTDGHHIFRVLDDVHINAKEPSRPGEERPELLDGSTKVIFKIIICSGKLESSFVEDFAPGNAVLERSDAVLIDAFVNVRICTQRNLIRTDSDWITVDSAI